MVFDDSRRGERGTSLEEVLRTHELVHRPARPANFEAESRALAELAETLAKTPHEVLQRLVEVALEICRADSAGISILEPQGNGRVFRWRATAGAYASSSGVAMTCEASPCGTLLDHDAPLLFRYPARHFAALAALEPGIVELLLVPLKSHDATVGTVWVVAHSEARKFDAEDARVLVSLSRFAAAGLETSTAFKQLEQARNELESRVHERTRALSESEERFRALAQSLRESEARFRLLADTIPQIAWVADPTGALQWFNARAHEYTGSSPKELLSRGWISMLHAEDAARVLAVWKHALESGQDFHVEHRIRRHDGLYCWFLTRAVAIRDENGAVVRWIGTGTEVQDQKDAQETLQEADRRKDQFLATLAHELRNPLAPIRTGLQIVRLSSRSDSAVQRTVEMMDRQLTHLVRLVDDLLDVARISSGKVELRRRLVSLRDVLASSVEASRGIIDAHEHELIVECPRAELTVEGDFDRLAQVFANLLSNAAKYTARGGKIRLRLARQGHEAVVRVVDTGLGIPPSELDRVFDLFSQVRVHQGAAQGGLGIGLSLVKSLVSLHGGSVGASSAGSGMGSTFTVRLPLVAASGTGSEAAVPATGRGGTARRRILIADDNEDAATALATLLEIEGHEIATASDGLDAVRKTQALRPEIVFLDLGMPKMDGIEAARRIRELPGGDGVVLVALTGWGQDRDRERTRAAGFDWHLTKPVDAQGLADVLAMRGGGNRGS